MKKLFITIFDQLETDGRGNIEFLCWLVCEYPTEQLIYQWQTRNFNFVVKPLYEQFFDWNCCVIKGSKGKIGKSVQNSLLTAFFIGKMKINHLGTWSVPLSWKTVDILGFFEASGKNILIKNMGHTCKMEDNPNKFILLRL